MWKKNGGEGKGDQLITFPIALLVNTFPRTVEVSSAFSKKEFSKKLISQKLDKKYFEVKINPEYTAI